MRDLVSMRETGEFYPATPPPRQEAKSSGIIFWIPRVAVFKLKNS